MVKNLYVHGHNMRVTNNGKHSEEIHKKIRDKLRNKARPKFSEEWKRNLSLAHLNHRRSVVSCLKQSKTCSGKPHPHKKHYHTDESKQKMSNARLGSKLSEEVKLKISKSHHGMEAIWMRGKNHPNWNNGSSFLPYCTKFNNKLREAVRVRDNYTCQLCNTPQNSHKHHVHHIHYDKENCHPDLITLCHSCNSKVNFNKKFYELLFMNKLNERQLLFWTKEVLK